MRRLLTGLGLACILGLLGAQVALAWPDDAKAQLSSTPAGLGPGQPWDVDVSFTTGGHVLDVDTLHPVITIHNVATGKETRYAALPTSRHGIFHATVVFPSAGSWTYSVTALGAGPVFSFPPVEIGAAPNAATSSQLPAPLAVLAASALAAVVGLGLVIGARRQRALQHATR